jgi:hypothetical protein
VRASIRRYDDALRRPDTTAVAQFWAPEYTFINPRRELLTRADRLANLRAGRTAFDSLAPVLAEEPVGGPSFQRVAGLGGESRLYHYEQSAWYPRTRST